MVKMTENKIEKQSEQIEVMKGQMTNAWLKENTNKLENKT